MDLQRVSYVAIFAILSAIPLVAKVQSFSLAYNKIKDKTSSPHLYVTTEKRIVFETLSQNPLLFQSTKPILNKIECGILSSWCQFTLQTRGRFDEDALSEGVANQQEGALLLRRLQHILHKDLLGLMDKDEKMVMPRYISYNGKDEAASKQKTEDLSDYKVEDLLPDGLHVDTNNSKHCRHWTILFYLDSCDILGATTFPLAVPQKQSDSQRITDDKIAGKDELGAATKLIFDENIQHTRFIDATDQQLALGRMVEAPALNLLARKKGQDAPTTGVRVSPKHGHYCLFSNLDSDGYPNPRSFHGGEAMYEGESKEVLTFFYEVPMGTFRSRAELGQRAKEREDKFLQWHSS